jgi:hypothetical protein
MNHEVHCESTNPHAACLETQELRPLLETLDRLEQQCAVQADQLRRAAYLVMNAVVDAQSSYAVGCKLCCRRTGHTDECPIPELQELAEEISFPLRRTWVRPDETDFDAFAKRIIAGDADTIDRVDGGGRNE